MKRTGTSVFLIPAAYAQLREGLYYYNNMKGFLNFCTIVAFYLIVLRDHVADASQFNSSGIQIQLQNNLEVPDSELLFLNRLKLKNNVTVSYLARQNQEQGGDNRRCTCSLGVCKCCTGYVMDLLKQKACMKVTYHPGDFAFDVAMSLNNRVLYENSMSGKNPRPICISPPRLPNLKVCAKFYNIFFPGRNFHFCLAMMGNWRSVELFNFAFDCLRMGADGIVMVKPDEGGGLPVPNPQGGVDAVIDAGDDDIEEYDENNIVRSLLEILDLEE